MWRNDGDTESGEIDMLVSLCRCITASLIMPGTKWAPRNGLPWHEMGSSRFPIGISFAVQDDVPVVIKFPKHSALHRFGAFL